MSDALWHLHGLKLVNVFDTQVSKLVTMYQQRLQEPLVAVEPHRPPMTNVGTGIAFRLDHCKHFQKSKHVLRSEVS